MFQLNQNSIYLSHCGLSPLYSGSRDIMKEMIDLHASQGDALFRHHYIQGFEKAKNLLGTYLHTESENMALVRNTTEAISLVANGYPWEAGDEIILYRHEYPANFYPWINLQNRGIRIRTLENRMPFEGIPANLCGNWTWEDLASIVNERTRMVVMSHVQFVSGYAADLEKLGTFCLERSIDLVVDVAQSLGTLPIDVEKYHISALAGSGWKWLRGPMGIAPFYTSPEMREKLALTVVGAETMIQGTDFLNHDWNPHPSARRFEYATTSAYLVAGLVRVLEDVFLKKDPADLADGLFQLQDHFLERLQQKDFVPLVWPEGHRSGILSLYHPNPQEVVGYLEENKIITSARGGFIRVAPHYYNTMQEMEYLAEVVNEFGEV